MRNRARPKHSNRSQQRPESHEFAKTDLVDQLMEFEDFRKEILPALRRDLKSGMSAKQLREKYSAMVQARLITEALTSADAGKATAAAVDVLNRSEGKATEKKEVTHKFADMKDEELDAILKSEEQELEDLEGRFEQ